MHDGVVDLPLRPDSDVLYDMVGGLVPGKVQLGARELWLANVLARLIERLRCAVDAGRTLVELRYELRPVLDRKRRPDVSFHSFDHWPRDRPIPAPSASAAVPDLAFEIVNPSNSASGITKKIRESFRSGVARVWVDYPDTEEVVDYDSPKSDCILHRPGPLELAPIIPGAGLGVTSLLPVA